jgi:hypothetical protein
VCVRAGKVGCEGLRVCVSRGEGKVKREGGRELEGECVGGGKGRNEERYQRDTG